MVLFFWAVAPCRLIRIYQRFGDNMFLISVGIGLRVDMASQPRKATHQSSWVFTAPSGTSSLFKLMFSGKTAVFFSQYVEIRKEAPNRFTQLQSVCLASKRGLVRISKSQRPGNICCFLQANKYSVVRILPTSHNRLMILGFDTTELFV